MATFSMDSLGEIGVFLMDVQTELVFFALACATHLLFFSKLRVPSIKVKGKKLPDQGVYPVQPVQRQEPGTDCSVGALKAALRAGDAKSAMAHFEELHSLWQQNASPSSAPRMLMEQLVKVAAKNKTLTQLIQLISKLGLLGSTLELVLAESAEHGDAMALKVAEQLARAKGVQFSAGVYQALIKGATTCGTRKDVEELMSEAKREGKADITTYNEYLSALLKWGNKQEARRVMESMRVSGLPANTATFNTILDQAVTSNVDSVWSIIDEMKASGVKPDQATCAILLKSRSSNSKAINLSMVMEMLDDLDGQMDEALFCSIVDCCVRLGRADLMNKILLKQRTSKLVTVRNAHTYGSIIRAYGYAQDMQGAWNAWHEMKKQHITPISVTLGCMVEALVTNWDAEGGYELIQEMRQDEKTAPLVNAVIYGSIVKGFSHGKCYRRVWEVYEEMLSLKLQFSMVTFNTLIDTCARSGELDRIPSLLKDIEAQGLKMGIVTYSTILKGYCQKNMLDNAFEMFEDIEKSGEFQPDEIMYNTLLDGCARQGYYSRGMALFEKMKKSGVCPSNFTLSVLVKLANRGKKLEKAFEVCDEVTSKYGFRLNTHVFANLIQACINHNNLPRATGVLKRMLEERVRPDVRCYCLLLRAYIELHSAQDAAGILRAAVGVGEPHQELGKFAAAAMQPQGGLPGDLVSEILWGIMDVCRNERLAAELLLELGRMRSLKLDPKLRLRLLAYV